MIVYGFNQDKDQEELFPSYLLWPEDGHYLFRKILDESPENRLALYEDLLMNLMKVANQKVIFLRLPPTMHSFVDEEGVSKISLRCRFSVADQKKETR